MNEYEQQRATLAGETLGYVGFAADIFGSDYAGTVPMEQRGNLTRFYRNQQPELFMSRFAAAVRHVAAMPEVDTGKIALAGYCFGGSGVLMYAIDEERNTDGLVKAVVSFHGGLGNHIWDHRERAQAVVAANDVERPHVLVLSGGIDDMASDIMTLEQTLDNATVNWEITRYSGIDHGWTNWFDGRYNEWADLRSWESMIEFLEESFGESTGFATEPPETVEVEEIPYVDEMDGKALQGYLARPNNEWQSPSPAVVIIP